jgi:glucose-6-phosphate isomerase
MSDIRDGDIHLDYGNAMAERVGKEHGIAQEELDELGRTVSLYHTELLEERKRGVVGFYDLPYRDETVSSVKKVADDVAGRFDNLVVVGIGGAALGTIALHAALCNPYHNLLDRDGRGQRPRLFVSDDIDPSRVFHLISMLDLKTTAFNIVSKSGTTVETISQFLAVVKRLKDVMGDTYRDRIIVTTRPDDGWLREIAEREQFVTFEVPENVGGRFSALSPVGLFPAAVAGIDVEALVHGAARMDERCKTERLSENPAYMGAAIHYLSDTKKGKNICVMMSYSYLLRKVAAWFRQLWAESLGKKTLLSGEIRNTGQTPVEAVGVTDQHSQLQLYMEGPRDKIITFLAVRDFVEQVAIPWSMYDTQKFTEARYQTLSGLMEAERLGTQLALTGAGVPNMTVELPHVDPYAVGQLLYMFEVQTAMAGKLYRVNAFDQPGVDELKRVTRSLDSLKGGDQRKSKWYL